MGPESLYCSKWRNSTSRRDLDLGLTIRNIELVLVIFIYYNAFKFHVPRSISCLVIVQQHTYRSIHTRTHMDAHKDSDEYSLVAFCKNATITTHLNLEL